MKLVLVHGYTMNNLGDDLFFRVLVERYPDVQFYLPTLNVSYKKKYKDIKNLKVIDFGGISRFTTHQIYKLPKLYSRKYMKKFDAVVCIGGSLFIDRKNPSANDQIEAENYSFICDWEYAQKNNVPYFVLGANWGPCYNKYFYEYFSRAFDSLTDICFRDQYSYKLFSKKTMVRRSGDILMGHSLIKDAVHDCKKKKRVSISVVDACRKCEENCNASEYEDKILQLSIELLAQGYELVLLSFCESEGDMDVARRILEKIPIQYTKVSVLNYLHNWKEMLCIMAESEYIISSRFHATVLGWTVGTKVYSLTYGKKTVQMINDCGFELGYTEIWNMKDISFESIKKNAVCPSNIDQYSGETAFEKLDQLLNLA